MSKEVLIVVSSEHGDCTFFKDGTYSPGNGSIDYLSHWKIENETFYYKHYNSSDFKEVTNEEDRRVLYQVIAQIELNKILNQR